MKNSKFQLILLVLFGLAILIGTAFFAIGKSGSSDKVARISVWGYMDARSFDRVLASSGLSNDGAFEITYTQKNRDTFTEEYITALADKVAPDIILIGHDQIYQQRDRVITIPYSSFSQRSYQNTFVDGADIFTDGEGIKAFPLTVDPLVLYWNKNIFTNEGVISSPRTWATYTSSLIDLFTQKSGPLTINQSAIPLGGWDNIQNAKGILSALILQGGGNVLERGADGLRVTLRSSDLNGLLPAEAALNFYVDFSDPQKSFYTWNRSLPNSQDYFIAGKAATYIGYASEIDHIKAKNPNLQFDIALLTQNAGDNKVTYAQMSGVAISSSAQDVTGAFNFIGRLITSPSIKTYASLTNNAPARKDLLVAPDPSDPYESIIFDSAIISQSWLDPDPQKTDLVFSDMINSVLSGRKRVSESIRTAHTELENILK